MEMLGKGVPDGKHSNDKAMEVGKYQVSLEGSKGVTMARG